MQDTIYVPGEFSIANYNQWSSSVTQFDKSILTDMERMPFTDDIKRRADAIYRQMNCGTHRGKKRLCLIFKCVYEAHKELNIPVIPKDIAKIVGITKGEMSQASSMFSESRTGYKVVSKKYTPQDFLPEFARKIELSEDGIEGVMEIAGDIINKYPELSEKYPDTVAAGILRYYLLINGFTKQITYLSEVTLLSDATIISMFNHIWKIDNAG